MSAAAAPPPPLPDWLARELPFRRALVDVGGGLRMHVMEQGAGLPVVLLHGNPSWGYLWRKVARALAADPLRLVIPDLIGLGLSDKPRDPTLHSIERHARWLGALVDALGLDRFILAAQDWGGPIGLHLLAERPSLAAGVVLGNTVIGPPRPGFRPTLFHRFARLPVVSDLVFRYGGFPQRVMTLAQGDRGSIRGPVARAYRWPLRHRDDRVAPLALARMVPDSPSHPSIAPLTRCLAFMDGFSGPVAAVWGDRDPVLGSVGKFVERRLPQARVTHTAAGHFLQEEVPDALAAAIRDVAARVTSAAAMVASDA
jgi:pimeloyl-ACP methyl ester carboxylesterase